MEIRHVFFHTFLARARSPDIYIIELSDSSTPRCVFLTHLFSYNQKTHQSVLENTSMCVRKHTKACTQTHLTFTHPLLYTFEKYKLC